MKLFPAPVNVINVKKQVICHEKYSVVGISEHSNPFFLSNYYNYTNIHNTGLTWELNVFLIACPTFFFSSFIRVAAIHNTS